MKVLLSNKSAIITFFGLSLLFGALLITRGAPTQHEKVFFTKASAALEAEGSEVKLSEITDFDWDEVCYLYRDDSQELGIDAFRKDFPGKRINLTKNERSLITLVFLRDNIDVSYIRLRNGAIYPLNLTLSYFDYNVKKALSENPEIRTRSSWSGCLSRHQAYLAHVRFRNGSSKISLYPKGE